MPSYHAGETATPHDNPTGYAVPLMPMDLRASRVGTLAGCECGRGPGASLRPLARSARTDVCLSGVAHGRVSPRGGRGRFLEPAIRAESRGGAALTSPGGWSRNTNGRKFWNAAAAANGRPLTQE